MVIGLTKAQAAEAIARSVRKFDAMVLAGTMPTPRLLIDGKTGDVKEVWSRQEVEEYFERLPREGEDREDEWSKAIAKSKSSY